MTGAQALAGRAAMGVLVSVLQVSLARWRRWDGVDEVRFARWVTWVFAGSRLLLFGLLFGVMGVAPRGDVPGFYTPEAAAVVAGGVPYRDFESSYAPLHAYMDAVPLRMWHSPVAIMLVALLVEMLILPMWFRLGPEIMPAKAVRTAALLYLASPIGLQYVAVDGQDNVIIALLLALSVWLLLRGRAIGSGLAVGVSVCLTKVIPLVFAPLFFLTSPRRWRWAMALMAPVALVYGGFLARGLPVLQPLRIEAALRTAGNVPYMVETLSGVTVANGIWNLLTLAALCGVWAVVARAGWGASEGGRARVVVFGMVATALALMMFSKKSWPAYLMLVLYPLYLMFADRNPRRLWMLAGFSVVVSVEHSVWSTMLHEITSDRLRQRVFAGDATGVSLLVLEVLLLAGYGWLLQMALRRVVRAGAEWRTDDQVCRGALTS